MKGQIESGVSLFVWNLSGSQRSQTDLKEEIRSRKQKPKESIEAFYESIMTMEDRLPVPFSDQQQYLPAI